MRFSWVIINMDNKNTGRFHDEVVLITGGSNGIGAALANLFSQEGAHVWLLARREQYLETSLTNIKRSSSRPDQRHGYVVCDVSNESEVDRALDEVTRVVGTPDILINCAGVVHPGDFLDLDLEKFNWMMDINYFGTVHCIRKVLPGMISRGAGHIVNIASMAAVLVIYGHTAYAASKSAVFSLSEGLRVELKRKGVTVTVVLPTDTDTDQLDYENIHRPPETRALAELGIIHSPESVAREIMNGIARKKFLILPGFDAKLLYWAIRIFGNIKFRIIDWLIWRAQSKIV
jgi:3-dehydrosphinganine reductase